MLATLVTTLPSSQAAGLSPADLIGVVAILVSLFGLLLSAIGVLVLQQFRALTDRITELKADTTAEFAQLRLDHHETSTALWAEMRLVRGGVPHRPVAVPDGL